jgi:hypothetical protein
MGTEGAVTYDLCDGIARLGLNRPEVTQLAIS